MHKLLFGVYFNGTYDVIHMTPKFKGVRLGLVAGQGIGSRYVASHTLTHGRRTLAWSSYQFRWEATQIYDGHSSASITSHKQWCKYNAARHRFVRGSGVPVITQAIYIFNELLAKAKMYNQCIIPVLMYACEAMERCVLG